ncbi:MAG: energy-coupling factor ABC transporter ATP-binding protein [Oscillospiraceae bacterium]|jgi:cobalt/nickel transport system ATP-binding protein|nr:energy-coupling factor ABC transporter ATP-binding protein [Oscillospiraceae bacterium]
MLTLQNVTVIYPDKTKAIDNLSFTLGGHENIALIGENGAGKTSLLLAIVGILAPAGGTVEVNGIRLCKKTVNEIRKQIGLVFQNPDDQLFMPLIYDDIAFGCRNYGLPEEDIEARVDETLDLLNISHLRGRSSLKLSGGEKRLAAIATVLAMNPSVLLFDEPTAYLDPKAKRALTEVLKKLRHPKIIATHDMVFAAGVCDRTVILKDGRIMADGAVSLLSDNELMRRCGL